MDLSTLSDAELIALRSGGPAKPVSEMTDAELLAARGQKPDASADGAMDAAAGRLARGVKRANTPGDEFPRMGRALDAGARLVSNSLTFGLADKFAGGMDALTGQAPSYDAGVKAQRAQTQSIRDAAPAPAMAAEVAGGLLGGAGMVKSGLTLANRVGPGMLARILGYGTEGAAYGAAHGAGNTYSDKGSDYTANAAKGALTGAAIGGALPVVGSVAGAGYRLGSAFLGPRVEGVSRGPSAMLRGAAMADEQGMRNLPQMGPDAMLVDAGPAMLGLGQGAGTGTGPGRSQLVNALTGRDNQTGQRLAQTLDNSLGPSPVPSQVEAHLSGNRALVAQDYEPIIQNATAVNPMRLANQLDAAAVNLRGPAQQAVQRVRGMLDIPGNPGTLDPHPRALLSTRQAIDGLLEGEVNPQVVNVLTQARAAVDGELARAAPGIKAVDAQFSELSRQSEGLRRGSQVFDTGKEAVRPVELTNELAHGALPQGQMIGPSAVPTRIRQGARAEVDRLVGTNVNDLNTLERKLGTPQDWNSQKFATVFGEGPQREVAQALMSNRQFRDSYQKIVQNSQTAQRTEAAKSMDGAGGGNIPSDITATALGLKALNLVAKSISGASSANTKDEIGRVLASQGPDVQHIARLLLSSAQRTNSNSQYLARLLSSPALLDAGGTVAGHR